MHSGLLICLFAQSCHHYIIWNNIFWRLIRPYDILPFRRLGLAGGWACRRSGLLCWEEERLRAFPDRPSIARGGIQKCAQLPGKTTSAHHLLALMKDQLFEWASNMLSDKKQEQVRRQIMYMKIIENRSFSERIAVVLFFQSEDLRRWWRLSVKGALALGMADIATLLSYFLWWLWLVTAWLARTVNRAPCSIPLLASLIGAFLLIDSDSVGEQNCSCQEPGLKSSTWL